MKPETLLLVAVVAAGVIAVVYVASRPAPAAPAPAPTRADRGGNPIAGIVAGVVDAIL